MTSPMRSLYPALEPTNSLHLSVDARHRVYVEECGNPQGLPVIFLHGGPGSGCKPYHRQFFDPARYRIVLFDQRGCGRSLPAGETAANTTPALLADMEAIRVHLGIDRWMVFGGSWGATLGLLYAQSFPGRVLAMILRGAFLARQGDVDWFFRDGVNRIFPDDWEKVVQVLGDSVVSTCYQRMQSAAAAERAVAARAWSAWTGRVVTYLLAESNHAAPEEPQKVINDVAVECHYAHHRYFIDEDQILRDAHKLPDVPVTIVHGRRDLTCTLEASWSLHRRLPKSKLVILREAGHLASEPAMIDALVKATDAMAEVLT